MKKKRILKVPTKQFLKTIIIHSEKMYVIFLSYKQLLNIRKLYFNFRFVITRMVSVYQVKK